MESFRRNKSGGDRGFRGGRSFGEGNRKPATLYRAVCAQCSDSCEVPFKPTGERPVLCSSCFKKNGDSHPKSNRFDEPRRFGADRSDNAGYSQKGSDPVQKQLQAIHVKLDKILEMLGEIEEEEGDY